MYDHDSDEYINRLFEEAADDRICEFAELIPAEIGKVQVRERATRQRIGYLDWRMYWHSDMHVHKNGKYHTDMIQLVFFLNRGMEWELNGVSHLISIGKGESCIYHDIAQGSAGWYEGGCEFQYKNIQIPTTYFSRLIAECINVKERQSLEKMIDDVGKIIITPDMYRLFLEIEQSGNYREGLAEMDRS